MTSQAESQTTTHSDLSDGLPVAYDGYGRMKYHPDFHRRHGLPWTNKDERYLIENYEKDGPEAVSLVLERTIGVVMTRATDLRKAGVMPKRTSRHTHRRSRFG